MVSRESFPLIRALPVCVGLLCLAYTGVCGIEYHILGLVPLSGEQTTKGWAQWQGMRLAVEEGLYALNAIHDVTANFAVNDSKVINY